MNRRFVGKNIIKFFSNDKLVVKEKIRIIRRKMLQIVHWKDIKLVWRTTSQDAKFLRNFF